MTESKRRLKVFLCHAHSDKDKVRNLYSRLRREGVDAWLDKENLLPGTDWEGEIRKAVRESDVVVVCLSKDFNQVGFRQKEVRIALEEADKQPEGEIFIIPARLEECENLESLRKWHWVDLFEDDGYQRLIRALRSRADRVGATLRIRRGGKSIISSQIQEKLESEEKARILADEEEKQRIATEKAERELAEKSAHEKEELEKARLMAKEKEKKRIAKEKAEPEVAEKPIKKEIPENVKLEFSNKNTTDETLENGKSTVKPVSSEEELIRSIKPKIEKQENKKTNISRKPGVIATLSIIGLIGTICAVLISSPLLANLFSQAPEPTTFLSTPTKTETPALSKTSTQIFTPSATPDPNQITDVKGVTMRLVPAGEFVMGSDSGFDDERPAHTVYLDEYYIDKYEVTNALYKTCVNEGVCDLPNNLSSSTRSDYYENSKYNSYPVVYINWSQAKTYCEWRGTYLPTEAQWEKAARGTDERNYPWGEGITCDDANFCEEDTSEVGVYKENISPYGVYDMVGNVSEMTADWYGIRYYPVSPVTNPTGPSIGDRYVIRGGDYDLGVGVNLVNLVFTRLTMRWSLTSTDVTADTGFRCAKDTTP